MLGALPSTGHAQGDATVLRSYELRLTNVERAVERLERDYAQPVALMRSYPLETRLIEARLAYQLGDWESAAIMFLDLVENPAMVGRTDFYDTLLLLARSLIALDNQRAARDYLLRVATSPDTKLADEARFHLIDLALNRNDDAELRKLLAQMGGRGSPRTRYALGKALVQQRQYSEAVGVLQAVSRDPAVGRRARYYLGVANTALGDLNRARQIFDELTQLDPTGEVPAEAQVRDLALLAVGRLLLDAGDLEGAIKTYRKIPIPSPEYDLALYEMAWAYIKAEQYDQALSSLELLQLVVDDPLLDVEAHALRGRLNIFLNDYDTATDSFDAIVSRFAPIRNELEAFSRNPANIATYFDWLLERHSGRVDLRAPLTEKTADWIESTGEMKRVAEVFDVISQQQAELNETRQIAEDLERIVASRNRVELFPELKDGWTRALVLENQLLALSAETLDRQNRRVTGKLKPVDATELDSFVAWRKELEKRFESLPMTYRQYQRRLARVDQQFLDLKRQTFLASQRMKEVKRQLLAIEEAFDRRAYADGSTLDEARVDVARTALSEEKSALEQLYGELRELERELEIESRRVGTGDEAMQAEADLKAALISAHKREGLFYEQHAVPETAQARDFEAYGDQRERVWQALRRLGGVVAAIDGEVGRKASELIALIQRESGHLSGYAQDVASYTRRGRSLGRELGAELFDSAQDRMGAVVLNAEVGLIDVAWQQKREQTDAINSINRQRSKKLRSLQETLQQMTTERIELPGDEKDGEGAASDDEQ